MKDQIIVALGREHGSGGHAIAKRLAQQLDIALYDKELIDRVVETSGYSREMVAQMDERPANLLFSRRIGDFSNSLEVNVAEQAFAFLRRQAESGESFVVVGRCADFVLRENPNLLRVFITGNHDDKVRYLMRLENLEEKQASDLAHATDRQRKAYHNYHCDTKWGDSRAYDLILNSSLLGIEGAVTVLVTAAALFRSREKQ